MCSGDHLHFDYVRLAWDSGFHFQESKLQTAFDKSLLSLVEVEKVLRERDIACVEKHIPTILEFQLDDELAKVLEPTFVKIFKLAQLSIQYLKFCKGYLDNTVVILRNDLQQVNEELNGLKKCNDDLRLENESLQDRNIKLKETISETVTFKCMDCPKSFLSEDYLEAHVKRRHVFEMQRVESDKIETEIKELKQRLNTTEKYIQQETILPNNDAVLKSLNDEKMQLKFEQLKIHIEKELSPLRDEKFYRGMYEKWIDDFHQKFQPEKPKVSYADVGCECQVEMQNAFVQTDDDSMKIYVENDFKQLEEKIIQESETQRENLQKIIDQKLAGSLEKIETEMKVIYQKMNESGIKNSSKSFQSVGILTDSPIKSMIPLKTTIPQPRPRTNFSKTYSKEVTSSSSESDSTVPDVKVQEESQKFVSKSEPVSVTPLPLKPVGTVHRKESAKVQVVVHHSDTTSSSDSVESLQNKQMEVKVARRSLSSLKQAAHDEEVLKGLRKNVEVVVSQKLATMGVDSKWNGVPKATYERVRKILTHQGSLLKKTLLSKSIDKPIDINKIRETILSKVDQEVSARMKNQTAVKSTARPYRSKPSKNNKPSRPGVLEAEGNMSTDSSIQDLRNNAKANSIKTITKPFGVEGTKKKVLFNFDSDVMEEVPNTVAKSDIRSLTSLESSTE